MTLDFFARRPHYLDHIAPVWNSLPPEHRGTFHIAQEMESYARQELDAPRLAFFEGGIPPGDHPILTAAYGDLNKVIRNPERRIITMEHGVTQGFGTASYPGASTGNRDRVDLALLPNEYVAERFRAVRTTPCEVVGTPKMDRWLADVRAAPANDPPVIAVAFHWGDRHADPPESGSAFEHYTSILTELAARYHVIGHAHPLAPPMHRQYFEAAGFEWVDDFREILRRADVYLNDLSSTMYEFLGTGKPVIILNAPWFRRGVHWGIRFWDYSDVGIHVENPGDLFSAIDSTLFHYGIICANARRRAVADLYPYAGQSAERAVCVLEEWLQEMEHNVL